MKDWQEPLVKAAGQTPGMAMLAVVVYLFLRHIESQRETLVQCVSRLGGG